MLTPAGIAVGLTVVPSVVQDIRQGPNKEVAGTAVTGPFGTVNPLMLSPRI